MFGTEKHAVFILKQCVSSKAHASVARQFPFPLLIDEGRHSDMSVPAAQKIIKLVECRFVQDDVDIPHLFPDTGQQAFHQIIAGRGNG